jgi:hypothetical protein
MSKKVSNREKLSFPTRLRAFIADVLPTIDNLELLILRVALFALLVREVLRLWNR